MNDILKMALEFEKLAGGDKTSMQSGDIQKALEDAGQWGGTNGGFDTNSKVADKIFKIIDKYAGEGSFKVSSSIEVPSNLKVKIIAKAPSNADAIGKDLTRVFGPAMNKALKKLSKKMDHPGGKETVTLKWFNGVGY